MAQQGDDIVSLPGPPPPNPAARRAAIDAAMRRFDGLEDVPRPRRRFSLSGWASTHRAAAGGLATATLILAISIPAIQIAIRDRPLGTASESSLPEQAPAEQNAAAPAPVDEAPAPQAGQPVAAVDEAPAPAAPALAKAQAAEERNEQTSGFVAPPAPVIAAPAPPPPPPAPEPQAPKDAADVNNIVVTGTRVPRPNLESAIPVTVVNSQEIADPANAFLSRLQQALLDNDTETIAKLVALPFHVTIGGERRTYRSSRAIYNDFDRIFTTPVRMQLLNLAPATLASRDGGKLRGATLIWFGCGKPVCEDEDRIRIREVRP